MFLVCCILLWYVCVFFRSHMFTTVSNFECVHFIYRHSKCVKLTYHRFCCFRFTIPHYFENTLSQFLNNDSSIYIIVKKFVSWCKYSSNLTNIIVRIEGLLNEIITVRSAILNCLDSDSDTLIDCRCTATVNCRRSNVLWEV
jgi:hypothetical protein